MSIPLIISICLELFYKCSVFDVFIYLLWSTIHQTRISGEESFVSFSNCMGKSNFHIFAEAILLVGITVKYGIKERKELQFFSE